MVFDKNRTDVKKNKDFRSLKSCVGVVVCNEVVPGGHAMLLGALLRLCGGYHGDLRNFA